MKKNIIFKLIFILLVSSCKTGDIDNSNTEINNIVVVTSILLPLSLDTRAAVNTELSFDSMLTNKMNAYFTTDNISLNLVKKLNRKEMSIDIRTKVFLTKKDGEVEKLFIGRYGTILYKGDYYKSSVKLMHFLRDSISPPPLITISIPQSPSNR